MVFIIDFLRNTLVRLVVRWINLWKITDSRFEFRTVSVLLHPKDKFRHLLSIAAVVWNYGDISIDESIVQPIFYLYHGSPTESGKPSGFTLLPQINVSQLDTHHW